jgi:hypothetical protein
MPFHKALIKMIPLATLADNPFQIGYSPDEVEEA